ncbi:hypothetical protein AVEN_114136-1 [Araneus ventricosus]|uniref:Uncharacterized protein n=1 Tax=Araneus ventricosus TaxID=182803 RepID=A0A4Y2WX46_ARAVE|nr:hypothetical protein AVEN_102492-1 [Araneus ventricosus]GBO41418.1 hypothetical protein AVEN_114136-1 [Araneus ventricosus]
MVGKRVLQRKENTLELIRKLNVTVLDQGAVSVDPLEQPWSFVCSASSEAGDLSAIETAVIVVFSDLLTVCVAKSGSAELLLPANCCLFTLLICARSIVSCYLCYVFSCTL